MNGTAIIGGTAAIKGGGSAVIGGLTKPAVGSLVNSAFFEVPRAVVDPHTNIFTPGVLDVPITVSNAPATSSITNLKVRVGIQHANASDLKLTLIAPDGTSIVLADHN